MKMKTAMKKFFSLVLVAVMLVSAIPTAFADDAVVCNKEDCEKNGQAAVRQPNYDVATTCTEAGKTGYYCQGGHKVYVEVPAPGHIPGADATCTTAQVCTRDNCGAELTPALGHTPGAAATCTTAQVCTTEGCGAEVTAALGHTPSAAATCTTAQVCTTEGCGIELNPALGHNFVDGECANCELCYTCKNDPCTCVKTSYSVTINVNKDGSDSTFSRTYKEGTKLTLSEDLVDEISFGNATVEWIVNGSHKATNATVTVNGPMTISCSITNKESKTETIELDANGGRLQSYVSDEYTVVIGQPYGNLPTPTREGYEFAYWYYYGKNDNEVRVYNTTIVTQVEDLYAKWIANGITVTFQRYDMINGWVDVEEHTVPTGSRLTIEDGTFPSDRRVGLVYDISGFEIDGWMIAGTDDEFEEDDTEVYAPITLRPIYEGTVKLTAQEPVTGASWKSYNVTLVIGEVIGELKNPGARSTYAFDGWLASNGSTLICDRFCESTVRYYPHLHGTTFYAKWAGGITVNLHIHTNGNTSSASKIVPYYVAPATGVFDLKVIDMYSIYPSYYKYDDYSDDIYGWYDSEEWKNFCANRASHPATSFTDIKANGQLDFHIMLIDNGDNYSSGSGTADSSNPKTGDMIFTAVTVMGATAACLAALFYLNKKRSV